MPDRLGAPWPCTVDGARYARLPRCRPDEGHRQRVVVAWAALKVSSEGWGGNQRFLLSVYLYRFSRRFATPRQSSLLLLAIPSIDRLRTVDNDEPAAVYTLNP
jgi:hypothetical protein